MSDKDAALAKEEELRKLLSSKNLKPKGEGGGGRSDRASEDRASSKGDRDKPRKDHRRDSRGSDRRDRSSSRDRHRSRHSGGGGKDRDRSRERDDSKYKPSSSSGHRHRHHSSHHHDRPGSRREDDSARGSLGSRAVKPERREGDERRADDRKPAEGREGGAGEASKTREGATPMDIDAGQGKKGGKENRQARRSRSNSSSSSSSSSDKSKKGEGSDSEGNVGGGGKKRNRWDDSEDEKGSGESSDEEKGRRKPKPKASSDKAEEPASPVAEQRANGESEEGAGPTGGPISDAEPAQEEPPKAVVPLDEYNPLLQGCRNVNHYERIGMIAQGTYGVVYRAKNTVTKEIVALKQVKNLSNKEGFSFNALREINILLDLRHPNIVRVKEMVVGSDLHKVYMVMEYYENDLKHVLDNVPSKLLSEGDKKWLLHQLLLGIEYMHEKWYIHRDLKTSNLLISAKGGRLAIGDLGLARKYGEPLKPYTEVVVTPGYRCPELYLGQKLYSTAVDMWSIGCIFGELLTGKPMFRGENDLKQLEAIFKIMGTPTEESWPGYQSLPLTKTFALRKMPQNLRHFFYATYQATYSAACYSLLEGLLSLNPEKRLSAREALDHEYFKELPKMSSAALFPDLPQRRTGA